MQADPKDIDLIERYLDGELTEEEITYFQDRVYSDSEFEKLFLFRKELPAFWKSVSQYEEVSKTIQHALSYRNHSIRFGSYRTILAIAASVILLIGIGVVLFFVTMKNPSRFNQDQMVYQEDTLENFQIEQPVPKANREFFTIDTIPENKLIKPVEDAIFSDDHDMLFEWILETEADSIFFTITTGKNKVVLKQELHNGQTSYVLKKHSLPAGGYRWFLTGTEEVRKFYITHKK